MRVLLLSAYAAKSHVYWRRSLEAMMPQWEWTVLELPPRHFSWRVRGNPLYWSRDEREILERRYDLVVATSMVDLATLRGLVPSLAAVPAALYFHENQFEYPLGRGRHAPLEAQMVSLYSALAARELWFNSCHNRDSFFRGCEALLARLPDKVPTGIVDDFRSRATVMHVPLEPAAFNAGRHWWPGKKGGHPLRLLWTGRFEYDKGGERLLEILRYLDRRDLDYELALVGQQFRDSPPVFAQIASDFSHRLVQFGYLESREDYLALLRGADLVLSTALHEFQGLAVLEAVAAGCIPVVPDRLAYTELYATEFLYPSFLDDAPREARAAADCLLKWQSEIRGGKITAPDVSAFSMDKLAREYRARLQSLAGSAVGFVNSSYSQV
jgi:glycosyltransferase involved in cell wall biosynthesis